MVETLRPVDLDWREPEADDPEAWCRHCGGLIPESRKKYNRAVYCCRPCKVKAWLAADAERRQEARSRYRCGWCGEPFEAGRADAKFCSRKCQNKAARARRRARNAGLSSVE